MKFGFSAQFGVDIGSSGVHNTIFFILWQHIKGGINLNGLLWNSIPLVVAYTGDSSLGRGPTFHLLLTKFFTHFKISMITWYSSRRKTSNRCKIMWGIRIWPSFWAKMMVFDVFMAFSFFLNKMLEVTCLVCVQNHINRGFSLMNGFERLLFSLKHM